MNDQLKLTDAESMEYLVETGKKLVPVQDPFEVHGEMYVDRAPHRVARPKPELASVMHAASLAAVVDYVVHRFDPIHLHLHVHQVENPEREKHQIRVVHIQGPNTVAILTPLFGHYRERECLLTANSGKRCEPFPTGSFIDQEAAMVRLQQCFAEDESREQLLRFIGSIAHSASVESDDDGAAQKVVARKGSFARDEVEVPNPVTLARLDHFPEIDPVPRKYVFRIGEPDRTGVPTVALFPVNETSADAATVEAIHAYLADALSEEISSRTCVLLR